MKKIIFSLIAIAAITVSCNKNEPQFKPEVGGGTIYASIEDNATKTTYDEGSILWAAGDQISVLNTAGGIDTYTLSAGEGTKNGKFTSDSEVEAAGFAVYPAGNHSHSGTASLTVNLPTSYGDATKEYVPNTNVLMLGTATGTNYSFKHLGAAICVTVNAPVGTAEVSLTARDIAGDFAVTESDGQMLIVKADAEDDGQIAATDPTVSYKFKALTEYKDMVFYFPVPTGMYKVLKVELKDANGAAFMTKTIYPWKSLGRAQIAMLPKITLETKCDFENSNVFGVWGGNEPTAALSNEAHVSGSKSLKLTNSVAGAKHNAQIGHSFAYNLDMKKTYVVSFYVKSDVAGKIQFLYQNEDYTYQGGLIDFNTTTEWQLFKAAFSPADAGIIQLVINFGEVVANYYIDDFYFGEVAPGENLIGNGTFDIGDNGWMSYNKAYTYETSSEGYEGKCALFTLEECEHNYEAQLLWPITLMSGKTYNYSFRAKSDGELSVQFFAQNQAGSGGVYSTSTHNMTSEWVEYSEDFTVDREDIIRVGFQFGTAGMEGKKLWIDNVKLIEK